MLLVGLLCGLPTVVETGHESMRVWHTAHEALIMLGIWLIAMSSVLPVIVLERRDASALVWSLIAVGHGFALALLIQGVTGVRAFEPSRSIAGMTAFLSATVGIRRGDGDAAHHEGSARGAEEDSTRFVSEPSAAVRA